MDLFRKYQALLLDFANSTSGKDFLAIRTDNYIGKLTPNSFHEVLQNNNGLLTVKGTFYVKNDYATKLLPILSDIDQIQFQLQSFEDTKKALYHYLGLKNGSYPQILNDTVFTGNSDAGGNGDIFTGADTFANNRAAVTGTVRGGGDGDGIYVDVEGAASSNFISRVFLPFDTSSINDGANINGSTILSTYKQELSNGGDQTVVFTASTQAAGDALAAGDYDSLTLNTPTEYATRKAATTWNTGSYTDVTLTNQTIVSKTGYTMFCLRMSNDVDNVTTGTDTTLRIYSAEETTTASAKPKLVITYDVAGGLNLTSKMW